MGYELYLNKSVMGVGNVKLERWAGKGQPDPVGSFRLHREFGFISGKQENVGGFRGGKRYDLIYILKILLIIPCSH